jgi:integrase
MLRALLGWLRQNDPQVHVWAVLQGLCGLRLFEAAYLREQDFDPVHATIAITESGAHRPKNRHSWRTIPVCAEAARFLAGWISGLKVRHPDGYLFFSTRARSGRSKAKLREARVGALTMDRICHLWGAALERARTSGLNVPEAFTPRRLRATFVTALRRAGADLELLQAYIGHQPGSVLAAHYDKIDNERLGVITALAQELYEGAGAFGKKITKGKANGPAARTRRQPAAAAQA